MCFGGKSGGLGNRPSCFGDRSGGFGLNCAQKKGGGMCSFGFML